ncbi:NAD(P)H-binding protein [Paenibacillus sp. OV219]|uniref:NAD(P)H-binding protein n=1 Tax=Paenibacillus sp. OV219 TaxID=1884377 RepID=UPI0008C51CC9|nr:NAD(P)H-binding protein [Paenibacillus sp. OV219]SEN96501.1 NAD(P)H-binding [Paenibacillus sp. OV219]
MIVITTPTGQIGRQVLDNIFASTEAIRVIVRDPSRLSPRLLERVEIVQGSHDDIDVVTKAFEGADCVLWLVPPNSRAENPMSHYLNFTRPACEAIKSQGVKRVIGVSSLGRDFGKDAGLLSPAFAMDNLIETTGVSYRSLRMPFFMENLLHQIYTIKSQGMFVMPNAGDHKLAPVPLTISPLWLPSCCSMTLGRSG